LYRYRLRTGGSAPSVYQQVGLRYAINERQNKTPAVDTIVRGTASDLLINTVMNITEVLDTVTSCVPTHNVSSTGSELLIFFSKSIVR